MTTKFRMMLLNPAQTTLAEKGYVASLSIFSGEIADAQIFLLLTREDLEEIYASSHDCLGDLPKPKSEDEPSITAVAWPKRNEHRIVDDRERAEAINRELKR